MPELHDLELVMGTRPPLVVIETREEPRVVTLLRRVARRVGRPLWSWTVTDGLRRMTEAVVEEPMHAVHRLPAEVLQQIRRAPARGIFALLDFHPFLDEPLHVRLLREIAQHTGEQACTLVLVSPRLELPAEVRHLSSRFQLKLPSPEQLRAIVIEEGQRWLNETGAKRVEVDRRAAELLVAQLVGLTEGDARRLARGAICDDGAITASDIPVVMEAKYQLLGNEGAVHYEAETGRFTDIGGLDRLKRWLETRRVVFAAASPPPGLDPPRGVLLLGVQGAGKSLAAKAIAGTWGVPLLRLDFAGLHDKYHGETERKLREALQTADRMSPCVLWFDEIEKAISGDRDGTGPGRRLLGMLLTWMAERKSRVFLAATANDISALPPELLRKGRFDEIFFVDLPDAAARIEIARIHLDARALNPDDFDLKQLAAASAGFSGAEVETAIVSALYAAHAHGHAVDTAAIQQELAATRPLSVVMAESLASLRAWAADRTVPASG